MKYLFCKLKSKTATAISKTHGMLSSNCGEGYIDTAIKILLFGETVLPTLTQRIKEMFNYGG